ncbi:Uncharacterised protein [Mycobacteroides abscessus subsp. abscessus]|nr:Uncharacterised protein [Mycobacteroides abscessus subsp. abscessus]
MMKEIRSERPPGRMCTGRAFGMKLSTAGSFSGKRTRFIYMYSSEAKRKKIILTFWILRRPVICWPKKPLKMA